MKLKKIAILLGLMVLLSACSNDISNVYWRLKSIDGSQLPLSGKAYLHLTKSADTEEMQVEGFGGCNRFAGTVTVTDGKMAFSPLISTRMACPDMREERAFFKALDAADSYRLRDDTLDLLQKGKRLLTFTASDKRP